MGLFSRPGLDVIYSFTILGPGNTLTFTVTPGNVDYDPAIYVVRNCLQLNTCVNGADDHFNGQAETLTVSGLEAATYFFAVDSSADPVDDPTGASGPYTLNVTGNFGNPSAGYYTLTPCRVIDTRDAVGAYGGPALAAGASRSIAMLGRCAIPPKRTPSP